MASALWTPGRPSELNLAGNTATYTVTRDKRGVSMTASPFVGETLTFVLPDVDTWVDGDVYRLTNTGPYAPEGNVRFQLAAGNTARGIPETATEPCYVYVCGDETITAWPDVLGTHNVLFTSSKQGRRQVNGTTFANQQSITSAAYVDTGWSYANTEKLQTRISRETVRFNGVFSTDGAAPRVVSFAIADANGILAEQSYCNVSPWDTQGFEVEYFQVGLRASHDPAEFTLMAKTDGGTLWLNRPAATASFAGKCRVHVEELPI